MKTKKTTKQEMTLLTAVEQIVELSCDSKLEPEFFRKAAKPIKYLADRLELIIPKTNCTFFSIQNVHFS